MSVISFFTPH